MDSQGMGVLLLESDPEAARSILAALAESKDELFKIDHATNLGAGIKRLSQKKFKVILLNLDLPDSQGIETFNKLHRMEHQIPIVVLSGFQHQDGARLALQHGAQDYLLRGRTRFIF